MHIVNPEIESYLKTLRYDRDKILLEMEEKAETDEFPIVGPDVGQFLYLIAKISGAKSILELGSGFGYSAYFFARALPENGKIICTDIEPKNKKLAEKNFKRAGFKCNLQFLLGDAIDIANKLDDTYDIIFNDIDKEDYPDTINIAYNRLKKGGIFITDNTLWKGQVIEENNNNVSTRGVVRFNEMLKKDKRFETSYIPIRDGIAMSVKI